MAANGKLEGGKNETWYGWTDETLQGGGMKHGLHGIWLDGLNTARRRNEAWSAWYMAGRIKHCKEGGMKHGMVVRMKHCKKGGMKHTRERSDTLFGGRTEHYKEGGSRHCIKRVMTLKK